ncbi:MAG TPA: hypothetical protein VK324_03120, partial [Tepidisphaeraceae bacterium]|nr:hypothetical protein [Tepidisphaeraceae bacterium]
QINLCVALPMAVGVWYAARAGWLPDLPAAIPFPLGVWRVDTVLLIVLSLPLVPTAMNRWTLGRAEGVGLILMYGVYLVLVTLGSWR